MTKKHFKRSQVDRMEIIAALADMIALQDLHKHERKKLLEETLQKAYKLEEYTIWIGDFEWISRKAEKFNLAVAKMSLSEARSLVLRRMNAIAGDPEAQNRDKIMANQLIVNMAGLDAKFSGGFEDDTTDELVEIFAEIENDKTHGGLNSDVPPEEEDEAPQ